ncbi:phosphoglycerate dehydrogenase [Rubrivirga sp. S365]|uniref:D-3-phosphoglycerate dehydrogenase n=1 Tax=Rubrivirga litoralis TaxID=3075598 RepID=A0ABU3BRV9_9BACT|nr:MULTISPECIES: phosphoglycerate dehydrogenase [unclassified Rubrivirga]MDT0632032.1 phosphoglycerate dehydrogenase [Rubrivirga sp. F394]MDT7855275.1 phosphoglycerate dehydrogenase [Rubrivirga sp. S365]
MAATSLDKDKIKVLLLEGVHDTAVRAFREAGYTRVEREGGAATGDALLDLVRDVHFLGIRSRTQLTADVFRAAEKLVAVGAFCIGTNQIDLEAASRRGVAVFNAPFSNTRSVAELVLAEAILLLRGVPEKNARAHRGEWAKSVGTSREIRGKTLGIVGYGNIGKQLSVLAEGLGMRVVFYDTAATLPLGNAHPAPSLGALLDQADVVTLHVPDTSQTRGLVGAAEIARMKPDAVLLNASRGSVVDLSALAAALGRGHLAGAAVDVYPTEPASNDDPFTSPLQGIDRALLTPHVGGSTVEAQENIGAEVAGKLVRYSDNGSTETSVNVPEVALPPHPGAHRILHMHRNVPGVIAAVNGVFSDVGANVEAQFLQTRGDLGYVVTDLDGRTSDEALGALREVEGTIRTRVLF